MRVIISLWDTVFGANTERFQGLVPLLPHLCPLSVPKGGVCGYIWKALEKGFLEMYWLGGVPEPYFFRKLAVTVDRLGFFCLFWSGFRKLHRTPTPITPTYGHMRVKSFGWICCI